MISDKIVYTNLISD